MFKKIKKTKPTTSKQQDDIISFYFALKGDITKDEIKQKKLKGVVTLKSLDDGVYVLYLQKGTKLKDSEDIAIYLLDMLQSNFENGIAKTTLGYRFIAKDKSDNHKFNLKYSLLFKNKENKKLNTDEIKEYAESIFEGNAYRYTQDSVKELKALYLKKDIKIYIALGVLSLSLLVSAYVIWDMTQPKTHKSSKPKRPYVAPLGTNEIWFIKNKISKYVIDDIFKQAESIYKGDKFNNPQVKRITSVSISDFDNLPVSRPYYSKATNEWRYNNKQLKRGGYRVNYSITYQKTIPDINYSYVMSKDGLNIYENTIKNEYKIYGIDVKKSDVKLKKFTIDCMKQITSLPNESKNGEVKINKRTSQYLDIIFSNIKSGVGVKKLRKLSQQCPIYFDSITLSGGKIRGGFVVYKEDKDEK